MNLRISENQLRFRITQGETKLLRQDGVLAFSLNLGAQTVEYSVALADLEKTLALDVQKSAWKLLVDSLKISVSFWHHFLHAKGLSKRSR